MAEQIVNPTERNEELTHRLSMVYTDMLMLKDGSWEPDGSSINATLGNLEVIAALLGVTVEDNRDPEEDE